jgi:hypothetical protein
MGQAPTHGELIDYVKKTRAGGDRSVSWTIDAVAKKYGMKESEAEALVRMILRLE